MSSCRVVIPFTPKPKASVRMSRGRAYNPSARGMKQVAEHVKKQLQSKPIPLLKGPLFVVVHFVMPAPLGLSERKRQVQNCLPHTKRPDGDNLEKYLNDALTGIVWSDDAQITWILRSKTLTSDKEGYTVFSAQEINDEEPDYNELLRIIREHIYIHKGEENETND